MAELLAARSAQLFPNLQLVAITNKKSNMEEMMKLKLTLAVAALLTIGLSSAAAYADTITFTLTDPTGYVVHTGGSLTFDATVSAPASNGAPVFLNGDSFNVTAPITLDDSDFFSDFPLSLAPGTSFTGDLFVLTVPPNSPFGTFLGTFTLEGGANGNADSTLGTVSFDLITTPEPSSIVLSLTGMAGLAWAGFKKTLRNWVR
jgi:hypothetical protein